MVLFPNCKINLGLNIIEKRSDGYHDLETIFFPVKLHDALEVIRSDSDLLFHATGLSISGDSADNLCIKAYQLLKKDFPQMPAVQVHLHKAIPMGAGLGGGSADGAYMLRLLDQQFQLGLSNEQLAGYALQLGSDCPFFIINKPCFATGRGEKLKEIELDLSAYKYVLIHPGIHISTTWAFSQIIPRIPSISIEQIIEQPVQNWKGLLVNDFELPVIEKYPAIGLIRDELYQQGAVYASLTGSGSTVYALFHKDDIIKLSLWEQYLVSII